MATSKRAKNVQITTGIVTLKWPKLFEPDYTYKDGGEKSTKFVCPPEEAKRYIEAIEAAIDKAEPDFLEAYKGKKIKATSGKMKGKMVPVKPERQVCYSDEIDKEGNETGMTEFKAARVVSGTNKQTGREWTWAIPIFDAGSPKPKEIKQPVEVWSGSTGKVFFEIQPYAMPKGEYGVSLKLISAQLIEVVNGGAGDPDAMGFGAEEGGYSASDDDETTSSPYEDGEEEGSEEEGSDY